MIQDFDRFYDYPFLILYTQIYFDEDHGVEFVYKEPKLTSLSEISERLHKQYKDKFGEESVKMIMDSSPVSRVIKLAKQNKSNINIRAFQFDINTLDPKLAYLQVTHVTPYFCKDELETRQNDFEQNHDVDTFMFETPFTKTGSARGCVEEQWKRRTILTSNLFSVLL